MVVSYPSDCLSVPVPYHPGHVHMISGDSVGGGGDSPAKTPHRDKGSAVFVCSPANCGHFCCQFMGIAALCVTRPWPRWPVLSLWLYTYIYIYICVSPSPPHFNVGAVEEVCPRKRGRAAGSTTRHSAFNISTFNVGWGCPAASAAPGAVQERTRKPPPTFKHFSTSTLKWGGEGGGNVGAKHFKHFNISTLKWG